MLRSKSLLLGLLFGFILCGLALAQKPFIYDAKGKRNPFIPLVTNEGRLIKLDREQGDQGGLSLEGIIYDKDATSFVLINGKVLGIGDAVDGYQVLKIEENKVFLIREGKITEVGLKKEGE
jgi:hypothetical protein